MKLTELKVGQKVKIFADLPRVVEVLKDRESAPMQFTEAFNRRVHTGVLVVVSTPDKSPGKVVGVQLDPAPKGYRFYDAHECDGECKQGFGWWISPDEVTEVLKQPSKKSSGEDEEGN